MIKKTPNTALKTKPINPTPDMPNNLEPALPIMANDDPIINEDIINATDNWLVN